MKSHWTQTPAGREKMREIQQLRWKQPKRAGRRQRVTADDGSHVHAPGSNGDAPGNIPAPAFNGVSVEHHVVLKLHGQEVTLTEDEARLLTSQLVSRFGSSHEPASE